jgi:fluoroacetyl-CoA thioesterase
MSLKGRTAEATLRMPRLTAEVVSVSDGSDFPAALPRPRLSELMELAAARVMRRMLRDGESSVALSVEITHAVSGPSHGNLRAVATHQGVSGRVHRFLAHVFDESGLIASGEIARAVVADPSIEGVARRRFSRIPMPAGV